MLLLGNVHRTSRFVGCDVFLVFQSGTGGGAKSRASLQRVTGVCDEGATTPGATSHAMADATEGPEARCGRQTKRNTTTGGKQNSALRLRASRAFVAPLLLVLSLANLVVTPASAFHEAPKRTDASNFSSPPAALLPLPNKKVAARRLLTGPSSPSFPPTAHVTDTSVSTFDELDAAVAAGVGNVDIVTDVMNFSEQIVVPNGQVLSIATSLSSMPVLRGGSSTRFFNVGGDLRLDGLVLRGGAVADWNDDAASCNADVEFIGCGGGAIYVASNGVLTVMNCVMRNNVAYVRASGGAFTQ